MPTSTLAGPTTQAVGPAAAFPASNYAIQTQTALVFFTVRQFKNDKGQPVRYIRRLIGAPGTWQKVAFNAKQQAWILGQLEAQGPQTLAKLYADTYTCCARCGSPLSDETSRARGLGPDCWKSFGY